MVDSAPGQLRGGRVVGLVTVRGGMVTRALSSGEKVSTGEAVLAFDDRDWSYRREMLSSQLEEQEVLVSSKELLLHLKNLDPLPGEYRNLKFKRAAASEKLGRLQHELEVYKKLHRNNIVSDLTYREKMQDLRDAETEVASKDNDLKILNGGLENLYVTISRQELQLERIRLGERKRELAEHERNHSNWLVKAPFDGVVTMRNNYVGSYVAAEVAVGSLHDFSCGAIVDCRVSEREARRIRTDIEYDFVFFGGGERRHSIKVRPRSVKRVADCTSARPYLVECMAVGAIEDPVPDAPGVLRIPR
ncbi:MAG: hypothetical protein MJ025_06835 [Victivallaceae bacterium]|nr:hypothetical protein [Victivallaceae bacterium]